MIPPVGRNDVRAVAGRMIGPTLYLNVLDPAAAAVSGGSRGDGEAGTNGMRARPYTFLG